MAATRIRGPRIAGIGTCVPAHRFDNMKDATEFAPDEVRKVVSMAGVNARHLAPEKVCSSDLCAAAAEEVLQALQWERESIEALIMVTQTPDYLLPSTSCILQHKLRLPHNCAAFDVGLGCSGYTYGLWLASMMLESGGLKRVLLLHGETPGRFAEQSDRSVSLLFGDAGSATALQKGEGGESSDWFFLNYSDGSGFEDLIIEGGGFRNRFPEDPRKFFVKMNGANIFNFTIKRVPPLIQETFKISGACINDIDYFIFHQSNQFIIRHLMKKLTLPDEKVPLILKEFGNTGGPSIPLTITQGQVKRSPDVPIRLMLLSYGVGLSWGSALIALGPEALIQHTELIAGKEIA
jgi:3-oxoacyl-[acyl-carrier-protein] synthase III